MARSLRLSRRSLLRGAGAAIALPWLEAMLPRGAGAAAGIPIAPRRLAVLYMPNGVNEAAWSPAASGSNFELSPALAPLAALKSEILVLKNLWNRGARGGDGHYVKTAGFLTGATIAQTTGRELDARGVSMDQVAAAALGAATPLPSLELSVDPVTAGIDVNVNYTRLYGSYISWSAPTTPLPRETDPRRVFDRVFRVPAPTASALAVERSVLDLVEDDARRLSARLGRADRAKLGEYLEAVRGVERRLEFAEAARSREPSPAVAREADALCERAAAHFADPARQGDVTERVRLFLDLLALAFAADATRVATFMLGNAVSGRNFSFLEGVKGGFHEFSHHEGDAAKLDAYLRINRWHVEQYAYFLERLRSFDEGGGSLLDQSMVLLGAGLRDGNRHDPHDLPLVLAGRGGGSVAAGRHLVAKPDTPLCNLHLALLRRMGIAAESFGDSTGELAIG